MVPDHWSNDAMVSMDRCGLFNAIKMLLHEDENDFMNSQVLSRCSLSAGGPISVKQFLEVLLTKLVFRHLKIFLTGPRELWGGTE